MMRTHSMRAVLLVTALLVAVSALAQTEYESLRGPALQRLGAHLQTDAITVAREELAAYCTQYPGDAVMQYNLACLDALVGRTDAALAHLDDALAAGYRDLGRILHDPDLAALAGDPRLTNRLDTERSTLTARMMDGAFDLEEGAWSERMPLLPDPFGPGLEAAPDTVRVRYDRDGGAIYQGGVPMELTPRELALMHALLARPGHAVAKERLFEQVFPGEAEVRYEAIEVVAYRLRRKLAGTGLELVTLRGLGYLLRAAT